VAYKLSELKATNEATDTNVLVGVNGKGNVSSPPGEKTTTTMQIPFWQASWLQRKS